jgi:hypothetical protein
MRPSPLTGEAATLGPKGRSRAGGGAPRAGDPMADTLLVPPPSPSLPARGRVPHRARVTIYPRPQILPYPPPISPAYGRTAANSCGGRQPGTGQSLVGRGLGDKHLPLKRQVVWFPLMRNPGAPEAASVSYFYLFQGRRPSRDSALLVTAGECWPCGASACLLACGKLFEPRTAKRPRTPAVWTA